MDAPAEGFISRSYLTRDAPSVASSRASSIQSTPETPPSLPPSPSIQTTHTAATDIEEGGTVSRTTSHAYPPSAAPSERPLAPLPKPDSGRDAYLFLFAAFVVETVVWGVPSCYGIFLEYYQKEGVGTQRNKDGAGLLPLVGTFSSGLMYLLGPPVALILNPRPRWRTPAIRIGSAVCALGLLLSAWATKPWHLLLTQGILYSFGGSFVYYPTFSFLSEWFVARRGFANGVCFAGTAAGGLVYPFVLQWLLSSYGPAVCLQALAGTTALLLGVSMPLLRPRIPVGRARSAGDDARKKDHPAGTGDRKKVWRSLRLWMFMLANVAQAFGFFLPTLYLPTFASSLGLSGSEGSGMLACVNATSVISRVALGVLSDKVSPHILGAITMTASSICVVVLWGVTSTSLAPLLVFSLVLGLVAGGWTSLYSSIIRDAAKDDPQLATTLFGLVSFTRGVGSLLTAPVSSFLLTHPIEGANKATGFGIDHGKYASLVVFTGISLGKCF